MLIGAPELHHWHHDRDRDAGNYANISPLMDCPLRHLPLPATTSRKPSASTNRSPKTTLGQMLHPFLPKITNTSPIPEPQPEKPAQTAASDGDSEKLMSAAWNLAWRWRKSNGPNGRPIGKGSSPISRNSAFRPKAPIPATIAAFVSQSPPPKIVNPRFHEIVEMMYGAPQR